MRAELGACAGQIAGINARLLERRVHLLELLGLLLQGGGSLVDLLLFGKQLVFKGRGIALGFLDLFLDVVILLLQRCELLPGGFDRVLLLLERSDVGLGLAEGLDLLLHGGNLLLCFGEGAIVAAAQLGVELK